MEDGAKVEVVFQKANSFQPFATRDGNLITGQQHS
jgi:hypothetical protein